MGALVFAVLGGALVIWFLVRRFWRRKASARPDRPTYVVTVTENGTALHLAHSTETGNLIVNGAEFPEAMFKRPEVCVDAPFHLRLLGIEALPLAQHRALEVARKSILLSSIFSPAGDLVQTLNYLAAGMVIIASIVTWLNFSSIAASVAHQQAQLDQVVTVLNSPLRVAPSGPPAGTNQIPVAPPAQATAQPLR